MLLIELILSWLGSSSKSSVDSVKLVKGTSIHFGGSEANAQCFALVGRQSILEIKGVEVLCGEVIGTWDLQLSSYIL